MSTDLISSYADAADFTGLFVEELGWNRPSGRTIAVEIDGRIYEVAEVASLKGITVWACPELPDFRTQREIDRLARAESTERLLIFHDLTLQHWQWPQTRDTAGAGSARLVTHTHRPGQPNPALAQRLRMVEISIDEDPTVVEVNRRLRRAFDADQVTKGFYKDFTQRHIDLCNVIEGIDVSGDEGLSMVRWYGSLLLNRLMFIYFMQRKGFLDNDRDYLRNRLTALQEIAQPESFYEFYRDLLLPLFHDGLGSSEDRRVIDDEAIASLIGDVPYVNGGIFALHPIEAAHEIHVPDKVFAEIFDFFDSWQWHLDSRPTGNPNEINPDVLGYIFERFVNHQEEVATGSQAARNNADKGAYYTKEDVTGYMTANALVPVFLERLEERTGVNPWRLLAENPDRYIQPSIQWGTNEELPESVAKDDDTFPSPTWSAQATRQHGLPSETWWEVVDRRLHAARLHANLAKGRVRNVSDGITQNLDLETLAVDCVDAIDTPADVFEAWSILTELKIVDPTCGSGAFLFSALGHLEALYGAALDAAELHARTKPTSEIQTLLADVAKHSSREYFVLKHAALNNLYGVDIMPEAVEIARLRLFLKLVAQIDDRADIEPLPDLEFNIRPGNILVGALDEDSIHDTVDVLNAPRVQEIVEQAAEARATYRAFAEAQGQGDDDTIETTRSHLRRQTDDVKRVLDGWWHEAAARSSSLDDWLNVHKPFHWFIEFPEVMTDGGFDVVVGNPPYVRTTRIGYQYSGFKTDDARDIYAPCVERASQVTAPGGRLAMIVPMNLSWGGNYKVLRSVLVDRFGEIWASTYDQMPSRLFEGVGTRNTILIAGGIASEGSGTDDPACTVHTTTFNKWPSAFRPHLMEVQRYVKHAEVPEPWPKVGHRSLIPFATARPRGIGTVPQRTRHRLGYKKTANYWISVFLNDPPCLDAERNSIEQTKVGDLYFTSEDDLLAGFAIAASRTMFLWWIHSGDAFDVTPSIFESFPVAPSDLSHEDYGILTDAGSRLHERLESAGNHLLWTPYAGGWYGNYDLTMCRDITDDADAVLLRHLDLDAARQEFEVELHNYHKSGGERPGTVRGPDPGRDRT